MPQVDSNPRAAAPPDPVVNRRIAKRMAGHGAYWPDRPEPGLARSRVERAGVAICDGPRADTSRARRERDLAQALEDPLDMSAAPVDLVAARTAPQRQVRFGDD